MLTQIVLAPPSETAPARPSAALIESRLSKFRAEVQPRVRALAAEHKWIADLATSFPAVLFALACPRRSGDAAAALRLVTSGAPLAIVAQRAGVPLWLRGFSPEAFENPLPALPDTPEFRRRVANHLPASCAVTPKWLSVVAEAAETADEDVALWFAREAPLKEKRTRSYKRRWVNQHRRLVALWAWYSKHVEPAQSLISTPWRAEMKWKAGKDAAQQWLDALYLPLFLGDCPLADAWLDDGVVDGYAFVALRTRADVLNEAHAMKNCVARYGQDLADNYLRLWSVRCDGERVATLSLETSIDAPLPQIRELAGPANARVSTDMWLAARRWLHDQDSASVDVNRFKDKIAQIDRDVWRKLWRPYWIAKRRIPSWLPLNPNVQALYDL